MPSVYPSRGPRRGFRGFVNQPAHFGADMKSIEVAVRPRKGSTGVVESLNNKAKVTMRKSYGFRTYRVLKLALYHSLGKLPEPESTHDFLLQTKK